MIFAFYCDTFSFRGIKYFKAKYYSPHSSENGFFKIIV